MLPARFYPGRERVGASLSRLRYPSTVPIFNGVDWFWIPSIFRAARFILRHRPEFLIFQWWTGTVLHSYIVLAAVGRLRGAAVIVEMHEVQDTGEIQIPMARGYVALLMRVFLPMVDGFVVHSTEDRAELLASGRIGERPVCVILLGPFLHQLESPSKGITRQIPADVCNVLFFGTIRPYKGLEDLLRAFNELDERQAQSFWLTVVGETWEGWTLPAELIERSPHRRRISFVNRYVHDDEVAAHFAMADAVVLPYHRSSASGPLHLALGHGLPVVVTRVGGLGEAAGDYEGTIFVPPREPRRLREALLRLPQLKGRRFDDPRSWERTVEQYEELFATIEASPSARPHQRSPAG
jgi:glycosyltransferase involved in cell wall biosynthesis